MFVSVNLRVLSDEGGAYVELPGLLTPAGALNPLLDYCLSRSHDRSIVWMKKVVRSVRMFLEYMQANPAEQNTHNLFLNFAKRLYTGTYDLQTGEDPSGLSWSARSASDAGHIITDLSLFFTWLGRENPAAARINPPASFNSFDRACDHAAYIYRRDNALLGHTWRAENSKYSSGLKIRSKRLPHVIHTDPPAFPDERFMELITDGFKVGSQHDYRGILITLLCHGAGFRESEPFHLYIEDVVEDPRKPNSALVRIHHPSQGFAPFDGRELPGKKQKLNRAKYLAERFGLMPRDQVLGNKAAGWKGGRHDGNYYKEAYWFPPELGEIFLSVWYQYLRQVACVNRLHPFAFVNLTRSPVGEMYGIAQFNKAHQRACMRIGLQVNKEFGTTSHGHRHAYGRRLKSAGIDPHDIQRFMHHSSAESQLVYTTATAAEARGVLELAATKLHSRSSFELFNHFA